MLGDLVISVQADLKTGQHDLRRADIEIMRPLGLDRVVRGHGGRRSAVGKQRDCRRCHQLEGRRREVARISRVNRCCVRRLPDDIDARAQLALMRECADHIEAGAEIERHARQHLPFVLRIDAAEPAGLAA